MESLLVFISYLLGSFSTSVWIGKTFYNIDVREFGSGNAGATNTFRVLGKKAGVPVLLLDTLKGSICVALAYFSAFDPKSAEFINLQLGLGIAVLIGHIFPIFYGFRGGKGVATILGIVICILPLACSLSLLIFLAVFFSTRIVSLSAMSAGLSFPIILNMILGNTNPILTVFSIIVALILIITHRKNIQRLLKKEESKFTFFSTKDK